jgi:hypothetical protein
MNRRTSRVLLAIGLSVSLGLAGSLAHEPALAQTSADSIKGYTVEKKNDAVAHGKKLMNELDVKIKDLENQVSRDMSAAGADVKRQMNDLKATRAETAKKLDEMGKASSQSWNNAKDAFADSYRDLNKAYQDAAAKVRK